MRSRRDRKEEEEEERGFKGLILEYGSVEVVAILPPLLLSDTLVSLSVSTTLSTAAAAAADVTRGANTALGCVEKNTA